MEMPITHAIGIYTSEMLLYVSSHQKTRFIEFFTRLVFFPFLQSFDMVKQKYEILDTNSLY